MLSVRRFFDGVLRPLAERMPGVNPNSLTAVSLLAGAGAGVAFWAAAHGAWYNAAAAGLVAVSGACDALDGLVARIHRRATLRGDFFDHFGDRLTEVAILGGISLSPGTTTALGFVVLVATLLHSYLGTQIEATFGHRSYEGPGKAEQLVALVTYGLARAVWPEFSVPAGPFQISLPNMFLAGLGAVTLAGILMRLRQARALGRGALADAPRQSGASWN